MNIVLLVYYYFFHKFWSGDQIDHPLASTSELSLCTLQRVVIRKTKKKKLHNYFQFGTNISESTNYTGLYI